MRREATKDDRLLLTVSKNLLIIIHMETRTRKSSPERREQIVRAVLRIIGESGITAFTTTTLAREVGVTSGALFRHFATRDEILRESVRYAADRIDQTFPDNSLPAAERLVQLARNRVRVLGSEPGIVWLLRSEQAYLALPSDAVTLLQICVKRSRQFVLDAIREGVSQGSIRDDIEPEILLVLVMGTIHSLFGMPGAGRSAKGKHPQDPDRILAALMKLIAPGQTTDRPNQN